MNTTLESIEQQELASAREQVMRIVQFAQKDPTFLQKVAQDPEGTLRAFGLPEHTIAPFLGKKDGHQTEPMKCVDTTCWSSDCPESCYITIGTSWTFRSPDSASF